MTPDPGEWEHPDCPICGPAPSREVLRARDLKLFTPGEFRLVRCDGCRLVYQCPRPSPAGIAAFYPPCYWAAPPDSRPAAGLGSATRATVDLLARGYPGGRVLDVGCGVGTVLALLRDRGLVTVGIEPSGPARDMARECYGLDVRCGTLSSAGLAEATFDAVTFSHVLEHLHDPVGELRRARALLRPGGCVVVQAPNIAAWQARALGRYWYGLDLPRHLFHFAPGTLRRALEAAGFGSISCRAVPETAGAPMFEIGVLYWLRDLRWRGMGAPAPPPGGAPPGDALDGQVYASVPSWTKRAFQCFVRRVLYAPVAVENVVGRSVHLLAVARR